MGQAAKATRQNRTITVDFQDSSTYFQLISDGKAFVEFVFAFLLAIGFQLAPKATCTGGGCLTRHSHYARIRLDSLTIWRIQCTTCKAVFTVLPHFVLRYRRMSSDVARQALLATHGGLSLAWSATICHISPMALYRLICALGQHRLVTVLTLGTRFHCGVPCYGYEDNCSRSQEVSTCQKHSPAKSPSSLEPPQASAEPPPSPLPGKVPRWSLPI